MALTSGPTESLRSAMAINEFITDTKYELIRIRWIIEDDKFNYSIIGKIIYTILLIVRFKTKNHTNFSSNQLMAYMQTCHRLFQPQASPRPSRYHLLHIPYHRPRSLLPNMCFRPTAEQQLRRVGTEHVRASGVC